MVGRVTSQSSHRLSGLPSPLAAYFVLVNSRSESTHVTLNLSEWSHRSVAPVILLSKESTHFSMNGLCVSQVNGHLDLKEITM